MRRTAAWAATLLVLAGACSSNHPTTATTGAPAVAAGAKPPTTVASGAAVFRVAGNRLIDAGGSPTRVLGVDLMGSEYTCVSPQYSDYQKDGVFDTPSDDAFVAGVASWHSNTMRLGLNEDCWLGVNPVERSGAPNYSIRVIRGADAKDAGAREAAHYQAEITAFVRRLHAHGLAAIIELHWSAPGSTLAYAQWPMPDRDHSIDFWRSVATTFRNDPSVIFEVFNEPFMPNDGLTWPCLRDGCKLPNGCADCADGSQPVGSAPPGCDDCPTQSHPNGTYDAAGLQSLVDAIRSTGARQPILASGRDYTNDLSRWTEYAPHDPAGQLGAAFHNYEEGRCAKAACWDAEVAPIAARVPVVTTEYGTGPDFSGKNEPCDASLDTRWFAWADSHAISYTAWTWMVDTDHQRPACTLGLLLEYGGTPRDGHGRTVHDHLAALAVGR